MVSFVCDRCQATVKKPKLDQHYNRCRAAFSCVDCYTLFSNGEWSAHTACISEKQKVQGKHYRGPKTTGSKPATPAPSQIKTPEPESKEEIKSAPVENTKKRSREEPQEPDFEETASKRSKTEETHETPSKSSNEALYKHLKTKKIAKKMLKKADGKTLQKDDFKRAIIKELTKALESDLDVLAEEAIAKFHVEGSKVSLKSRKEK